MKFAHFLLAAGICSFSAASAQTSPATPNTSTNTTQGPRGTTSASPSSGTSGTDPMPSNPKAAVSSGEVFTTGSPTNNRRTTKRNKEKSTMPDGKGKMKTKM